MKLLALVFIAKFLLEANGNNGELTRNLHIANSFSYNIIKKYLRKPF